MTEFSEYFQERKRKLEELKRKGIEPYPHHYSPTHTSKEILEKFSELTSSTKNISVAGRIMTIRGHGKATFAHLQDGAGKIQIYVREDTVGKSAYEVFKLFDISDIIGVEGPVFKTHTGEITVEAKIITLLCKSLRPLPEKWHGLVDKETRYRQRYADLIMNPQVKDTFVIRSKIIRSIRHYLDELGFLEVETPIIQPQYGGAFARPFITHHHALDLDLYLRISDELYLKRLIVGGFDKIYEFCKDFRNEGMDRDHNPEFTQLELYQAYADYRDMMKLTEELFCLVAQEVKQSTKIEYEGQEIDLTPPWKRISYFEAFKEYTGTDFTNLETKEIFEKGGKLGVETLDPNGSKGKLLEEIFGELVEPKLIQPTFVIDYPVEHSPLAKKKRDNPNLVERFEPIICGKELGNAFSELNDPLEQRERFEQQMKLRQQGEIEIQPLDEDFLRALEYGMPPTGGLGLGLDRIVMLFANVHSIRDVLFFPQMRPEILI
ncbi:MAG: lysine--tRNA ligase [Candidatus Edwardsbacteria bacterium]